MTDVPPKPEKLYELGMWKGQVTACIKKGIKRVKAFIKQYKMKKNVKRLEVTVSFLNNKQNMEFIHSKLSEISDITSLDAIEVEDDLTGLSTEEQFETAFSTMPAIDDV